MLKAIFSLIRKEITLEFRNPNSFQALLLYVVSAVMITYLSLRLKNQSLSPIIWNAIFWLILLFVAFNAIVKSFTQERKERFLYYYTICSPQALIIAKILYNSLLMSALALLALAIYSLLLGNPLQDMQLFLLNLLLGSVGFATTLTMISGIASKTHNAGTLMAILGFPVMLPMLLLLLKVSKNAIDGLDWEASYDEVAVLLAINAIVISLSYILFPFIWRN